MKMCEDCIWWNWRTFTNYEKACRFRDRVNGEIRWEPDNKGNPFWTVWYCAEVTKNE